jgi:hypothetical protein
MKQQLQLQLINSILSYVRVSANFDIKLVLIVNNLRLKIDRAAQALEELAAKGPLKCENLRGLDEKGYDGYVKSEDLTVINGLKMMPPVVGKRRVPDDTHYRIGWALDEDITQKMLD